MSDYPKTQKNAIRYLNMPKPVEEGRFRSVFAVLTDVFDGVVRYQALTTARKTIQDAEARLNWLEEERRQLADQVKDLERANAGLAAAAQAAQAAIACVAQHHGPLSEQVVACVAQAHSQLEAALAGEETE